jgi:hypothetical protein
MFLVPGQEAAYEDTLPVPHGEVRAVWYNSSHALPTSPDARLHTSRL